MKALKRWLAAAGLLVACSAWAVDDAAQALVDQLRDSRSRGLGRNLVEVPTAVPGTGATPPAAATDDAPPSVSLPIQFDVNSAQIRPESRGVLMLLAEALKSRELADARFVIEGHTDAQGRPQDNLKLSQARAQAVRDRLVFLGVLPSRLVAIGRGSQEPAVPGDPLAAENRRVRVVRSPD